MGWLWWFGIGCGVMGGDLNRSGDTDPCTQENVDEMNARARASHATGSHAAAWADGSGDLNVMRKHGIDESHLPKHATPDRAAKCVFCGSSDISKRCPDNASGLHHFEEQCVMPGERRVATHAATLEDRLQTLLQYTPEVSLKAALEFIRAEGAKRPECLCDMSGFPKGYCPAHPWRGQ